MAFLSLCHQSFVLNIYGPSANHAVAVPNCTTIGRKNAPPSFRTVP